MKRNEWVRRLVWAAVCLALCLVLPFLTGQIPQIASAISPMHIPVFLCGFLCGGPLALLVGAAAPLLRSVLFGMPPMWPTAACMAFELAAYGLVTGLLYRALPKKVPFLYLSLIGGMLAGRVVWGLASWALIGLSGGAFTFQAFLAGAFLNAVPALICHIVLVPVVVLALKKAKLA